jgi:hypothetical protein
MSKAKKPQPPLPDPPLLVLAKPKGRKRPFWFYLTTHVGEPVRFARCNFYDWEKPEDLRVIDHPRNDAEAVEIIKNARAKT